MGDKLTDDQIEFYARGGGPSPTDPLTVLAREVQEWRALDPDAPTPELMQRIIDDMQHSIDIREDRIEQLLSAIRKEQGQ